MTRAVIDDHLLRDALIAGAGDVVTTNLYYVRLCRSVVAARGGALTGAWSDEERQALGRVLVSLPDSFQVVPMTELAFRMGQLSAAYGLSSLGAEAIASAEHLDLPLQVWEGDDGPRIREAAAAVGVDYRTAP